MPLGVGSKCAGSWANLNASIAKATSHRSVITICPGVTLTAPPESDPIHVKPSIGAAVTVECTGCVIEGGRTQFEVDAPASSKVTFRGITFADATGEAMVKINRVLFFAYDMPWYRTDAPSEVTFRGCAFSPQPGSDWGGNNKTAAAISCVNYERLHDDDAHSSVGWWEMLHLSVQSCDFVGNVVDECVICNRGCSLAVRESLFLANSMKSDAGEWPASTGGALVRNFEHLCALDRLWLPEVRVTDSCFVDNYGPLSTPMWHEPTEDMGGRMDWSGTAGRDSFPCNGPYRHLDPGRALGCHGFVVDSPSTYKCEKFGRSECVRSERLPAGGASSANQPTSGEFWPNTQWEEFLFLCMIPVAFLTAWFVESPGVRGTIALVISCALVYAFSVVRKVTAPERGAHHRRGQQRRVVLPTKRHSRMRRKQQWLHEL